MRRTYEFHGTTRFPTIITVRFRRVTVLSGAGTRWGRDNPRPHRMSRKQAARMLLDARRRGYRITKLEAGR